MVYTSFSLKNFRGISEEVKIKIENFRKIISIIGNNESGKTTILKGIECIGYLCKKGQLGNGRLRRALPKLGNVGFVTVDTTFKCEILFSDEDIEQIDHQPTASHIEKSKNIIECVFVYSFEHSSPVKNEKHIVIGGQKYTEQNAGNLFNIVAQNIQDIVYLDDFLFTVPEEIVFVKEGNDNSISDEDKHKLNSDTNRKWQDILNDVFLAALGKDGYEKKHSIQKDIVDLHQEGFEELASDRAFGMGNYLDTLLKPWKDMQKQGDVCFDKFAIRFFEEAYIRRFKIFIEAQNRNFSLGERSRGFQWFVCFVLFTKIRLHRNITGTIFLLDEPASNLHILPQIDILQRMQDMCSRHENVGIIYTTHSPFLISLDKGDKQYSYTTQNSSEEKESKEPNISCYKTCEYDAKKHQPSSILTSVYGVMHKAMVESIESTTDTTTSRKIFTLENLKKFGEVSKIGNSIIKILDFFN